MPDLSTLQPQPRAWSDEPVWLEVQPRWRRTWARVWRGLLVVGGGLTIWGIVASSMIWGNGFDFPRWVVWWSFTGDPVLGIAAMILSTRRRRDPFLVAVAISSITAFSATSAGAFTLVVGSLGTQRKWRQMLAVLVLAVTATGINLWITDPHAGIGPVVGNMAFGLLYTCALLAVGYAAGTRRELLASLVDRAETAEREQSARAESARNAERSRIAREMHDVLAHRISLVAMHAQVLTFRDDLSQAELKTIGDTIGQNARGALGELRDILGVLRESDGTMPTTEGAPDQPQPSIGQLPGLIEEVRAGGQEVMLSSSLAQEPPTLVGRTAYRVVQEALTNARKHAPGAAVTVTVDGEPDDGLSVLIHNGRAAAPMTGAPVPGAGLGLVGVAERVEVAGGRLDHGPAPGGGYRLSVWLPWPA